MNRRKFIKSFGLIFPFPLLTSKAAFYREIPERQIVLDTEVTGLNPTQGHRIIEIGCVELVNRRLTGNRYHQYLNPEREIDAGAIEIHGITNEQLANMPRFVDIAHNFLQFLMGAELVIHNASFDIGFINHELLLLGEVAPVAGIENVCTVLDTFTLARSLRPGEKNDVGSLCQHYGIDASLHAAQGALCDARILADVYLAMTRVYG